MTNIDRRELFAQAADKRVEDLISEREKNGVFTRPVATDEREILPGILYEDAIHTDGFAKGLRAKVQGSTLTYTDYFGDEVELKITEDKLSEQETTFLSTEQLTDTRNYIKDIADQIDDVLIGGKTGRLVEDEERQFGLELAVAECRGMVRFADIVLSGKSRVVDEVAAILSECDTADEVMKSGEFVFERWFARWKGREYKHLI